MPPVAHKNFSFAVPYTDKLITTLVAQNSTTLPVAHITRSNLRRIVRDLEGSSVPQSYLDTLGKPWYTNLYNIGIKEYKRLLLFKGFYHNPEVFTQYIKSNKKDTYTYVYEAGHSSYHDDPNCPNLNASFTTPIVPSIVRKEGRGKVTEFRAWYMRNKNLLQEHRKPFYESDEEKEAICQQQLLNVHKRNQGFIEYENISLEELHRRIEYMIEETSKYYTQCNPAEKKALNYYSRTSSLGYTDKVIDDNITGMSDLELKQFLVDYHETFKEPLFHDLIEYYRVKFNPELEFSGKLLEMLEFMPCLNCCKLPGGEA